MSLSLEQLATKITDWCAQYGVVPANGQVAAETTVRTLRYYRTMGLLDAGADGGGSGYGEHHFLQAAAVRVLQGQGLPLSRIQSLLFARSDEELGAILNAATGAGQGAAGLAVLDKPAPGAASASISAPASAAALGSDAASGHTVKTARPQQAHAQVQAWQSWPVTPEVMLVSRRAGHTLTAAQIEAIRRILETNDG